MHNFRNTMFFAQYNCNTYGSGNYGVCSTTSVSSGGGASNLLANTGYDVLIPVFLGVSLVVAGSILLVRRWLRNRKQQTASE